MNDMELLFGRSSTLKSFWFDTDPGVCRQENMITPFLKIKNGEVIESQCKPNIDTTVVPASNANFGDGSPINMDNYKCNDQWKKYVDRGISQITDIHKQQFLTQEEAKTACMMLLIDDCVSIEEKRVNGGSVFNLKRWSLLVSNIIHTTYIRPSCRSDG